MILKRLRLPLLLLCLAGCKCSEVSRDASTSSCVAPNVLR